MLHQKTEEVSGSMDRSDLCMMNGTHNSDRVGITHNLWDLERLWYYG